MWLANTLPSVGNAVDLFDCVRGTRSVSEVDSNGSGSEDQSQQGRDEQNDKAARRQKKEKPGNGEGNYFTLVVSSGHTGAFF